MKKLLAILLGITFIFCGCAANEKVDEKPVNMPSDIDIFGDPNMVYLMRINPPTGWESSDTLSIINNKGEDILTGKDGEVGYLYDGSEYEKPAYLYTATIPDMVASESEYWEITNAHTFKIYSLDGKPLTDDINGTVSNAFGDFVIYGMCEPSENGEYIYIYKIMNIKTGEIIIQESSYIEFLKDYILINKNDGGYIILDRTGKIVCEEKNGAANSTYTDNNLILARDFEITEDGYNYNYIGYPNGECIYSDFFQNADAQYIKNGYITIRKADEISMPLNITTGEFVSEFDGKNVNYFDGEVAVVAIDDEKAVLTDKNGISISPEYGWIYGVNDSVDENGRVQFFNASNSDANENFILNREGKEILGGVDAQIYYSKKDKLFLMTSYNSQQKEDYTPIVKIYDTNGKLKADLADSIDLAGKFDNTYIDSKSGYLQVTHSFNDKYLSSLYDLEGNAIIKNARMLYSVTEDIFYVSKGFETGLMNQKGEWVYKMPAFSTIGQE